MNVANGDSKKLAVSGISPGYGSYDDHNGYGASKSLIVDKAVEHHENSRPTNQCVLGVAFFSFLGFTILQTGFAITAKSQAMLADSEAMFVDAGTYLFNMVAERLKHRAFSEKELAMTPEERQFTRRLHRLYLELIPPFISVTTLLAVTVTTLLDSISTLLSTTPHSTDDDPDLAIMLLFSSLNLILDMVNVTCFARVDQAVLTPLNFKELENHHEVSPLLVQDQAETESETNTIPESDEVSEDSSLINLNMCSAWTHVFADTLRSVAVLIAAGIASVSDIISPEAADSIAAVIVSFIILLSCLPLTKGLIHTAIEIRHMHVHGTVELHEIIISA